MMIHILGKYSILCVKFSLLRALMLLYIMILIIIREKNLTVFDSIEIEV